MTPFIEIVIVIVVFVLAAKICGVLFAWVLLLFPLAEKKHTRYDPDLGWVNLANVNIRNMYGEGVYFTTNAHGFRNNHDFSAEVPKSKLRIICSGDSFALGYGVDNDHCWPQELEAMDGRIETVNMGQGGYGIDQSYLWYMRDGTKLEHNLQLFTFIADDFRRAGQDNFLGYGKPVLKLEGGKLSVGNVPVPRNFKYSAWFKTLPAIIRTSLHCELLKKIYRKIMSHNGQKLAIGEKFDFAVALEIFENLKKINAEKKSILACVYLPCEWDLSPQKPLDELRNYLVLELSKKGILFFDLAEPSSKLLPFEVKQMFAHFPFGPRSAAHYSEKGNKFVAELLYKKIIELHCLT